MEARAWISQPDGDFTWSSWIDADHALTEIDWIIGQVQKGQLPFSAEVIFLPTGPMQELAMSSGWGDEFIELANRFDAAK